MVRFCRGRHLQRRGFITLFGGSVVAWPLIARAQQLTMPTVGFLGIESDPVILAGIRQGLTESGYIEGKSVTIEYRWAEGREDRLPALAEDLEQIPFEFTHSLRA
jgi:putative tryptophan/tyrosine transport system substrate-binding protein